MIRPGRKQTNWQPHGYQGFGFFIHGEHEKPRGSHRMMPSTGVKITTIIS